MKLANNGARRYKKGVCWTPSNDKTCRLDSQTQLWTCRASAHHNESSCGTWEIHNRGEGLPWQVGFTCDADGCRPYIGGGPDNIPPTEKSDKKSEEYTDALPEDYEFSE